MSGSLDERMADPSEYRVVVEQIGRRTWQARIEQRHWWGVKFYARSEARVERKARRYVEREVSEARRRLETRREVEVAG